MEISELLTQKSELESTIRAIVQIELLRFHEKTGLYIKSVDISQKCINVVGEKQTIYITDEVSCEIDFSKK